MDDTRAETPTAAAESDLGATPVMAQFLAVKRQYPDALLFFRMGDFYEMFFDDAVAAARALDIALTKRGKHLGEDIPMCGVPVHSHEAYLSRLIRKGHRVAVCEQIEDPAEAKKRGSKSVVKRDVVRLITPGTLTEDALLDARRANHLAALAEAERRLGLAWLDMSTGAFQVQPVTANGLAAALARVDPAELLVPDRLLQRPELFEAWREWKDRLTPLPASRFDSENGRKRLEALFAVGTLDAFGHFSRAEVAAGGGLVDYVELTQKGQMPRIAQPRRLSEGAAMEIDAATRRNLELTQTMTGERRGSLLSVIDRTVTGAGARLLAARLAAPLTDIDDINRRLDGVAFCVDGTDARRTIRDILTRAPDIERALSRLGLGRGGPRDLAAIRDGLAAARALHDALGAARLPEILAEAVSGLAHHDALIDRLGRALAVDLPLSAKDGGFIAPDYSLALDELRLLRDESRRLIAGLQARYVDETGIAALKIKHNNVIGYHIEVPAKQADKFFAPGGPYIHRQTMANAARFTTVELGELEGKIGKAADQALALELGLFADLVAEVAGRAEPIARAAAGLAVFDVAAALAERAVDSDDVRPILDSSCELEIAGGRHPVVEAALAAGEGEKFVPNDCVMAGGKGLWLLTGPNMAGKSTYLRQNALIALLAQTGAYVPARAARIGMVDRLFSRVGAADDLARGRSTFMVEMVETAAILNQATARSLVILDEIGRGTATFDGLSIAWAVVEHLHDVNRCRALFATHYHELTLLASRLSGLACHSMRVKEWQGEVVFLHEVAPGAADRSYGIHVAKLAGLPPATVARAEDILKGLEQDERTSRMARLAEDLPLFAAVREAPAAATGPSEVEKALAGIDPDALAPREALEALYQLKKLAKS